ncbi:hypothetical protein H4S07_001970 [Coemansia furcata]|uniref:Uncharacterized protein n=1 Tax=Coemansia furcata TaxID=417177 RepID=A0ACC1LLG8_9FUNG|nr:hypothetical protein H4S07_001970 [Coemansia furcata]
MTFGTELSLFGSRAQPTQVRGFSYTTLVDPDFPDGVQMYQADDLEFPSISTSHNPAQEQEPGRGGGSSDSEGASVRNRTDRQGRNINASDDCWSSITALDIKRRIWTTDVIGADADLRAIDSEDIPRIEGKARQLRRRAQRKIARALERARDGWEVFLFSLSQVKRRGGGVPGPCFY